MRFKNGVIVWLAAPLLVSGCGGADENSAPDQAGNESTAPTLLSNQEKNPVLSSVGDYYNNISDQCSGGEGKGRDYKCVSDTDWKDLCIAAEPSQMAAPFGNMTQAEINVFRSEPVKNWSTEWDDSKNHKCRYSFHTSGADNGIVVDKTFHMVATSFHVYKDDKTGEFITTVGSGWSSDDGLQSQID